MTHLSLFPSIIGYVCAGVLAVATKVAQHIPAVPDWAENTAMFGLVSCLIYATITLWKRNQKMHDLMQKQADKFHKEIMEEMKAQIDAGRASREESVQATRELSSVLEKMRGDQHRKCDSVVKRLENIGVIK